MSKQVRPPLYHFLTIAIVIIINNKDDDNNHDDDNNNNDDDDNNNKAVSLCPLILNLRVQSKASPRGICGWYFPLSASYMDASFLYFIYLLLTFAADRIIKQQARTTHLQANIIPYKI
jgi:hypothetical protein